MLLIKFDIVTNNAMSSLMKLFLEIWYCLCLMRRHPKEVAITINTIWNFLGFHSVIMQYSLNFFSQSFHFSLSWDIPHFYWLLLFPVMNSSTTWLNSTRLTYHMLCNIFLLAGWIAPGPCYTQLCDILYGKKKYSSFRHNPFVAS